MLKQRMTKLLSCCLPLFCLLGFAPLLAQRQTGELLLTIVDANGLSLEASVEVRSHSTNVHRVLVRDTEGRYPARELPFGPYSVTVSRQGFSRSSEIIEVRSEAPIERRITLNLGRVETTVTVLDQETLLNPSRVGSSVELGPDLLAQRRAAGPGRSILELVNQQPGWLLEANGVLHPRGSEYDTQYVIDGVPILDNRSPAFAPGFETQELSAMRIITAGFPAEYGRKLGGVVELVTARETRPGFHGKAALQAGSFGTAIGHLSGQYVHGNTTLGLGAQAARTDRFLDPPVEQNYSNRSSSGGLEARIQHDLSERDRVRFYVHRKRTGFLVPNDLLQEAEHQRQDRTNEETLAQAGYQHVFSPKWIGNISAMGRDVSARLWSNNMATPIWAEQDRGLREAYFNGSVSAALGRHSIKFGGEAVETRLREQFGYRITDQDFFEEDDEDDLEVPEAFRFASRRTGREYSAYFQDSVRAGQFTLSGGLRWDRYQLLVTENFWSPRLGAAWHSRKLGLVLRAAYDRAITTPAIENILLAASSEARDLTEETTELPIRPSRGNFYEVGLTKSLGGKMRFDASWYRRNIRNYSDDDVLLNTGVSFPIAFDRATIRGVEAKLDLPDWRGLSGFVSYSHLVGTGFLPITGGLFLDADDEELLDSNASFPITQDQRNTLQSRVRYERGRLFGSLGYWYNSGLPVELEGGGDDNEDIRERLGTRIESSVDLKRGRVKPSYSFDFSAGLILRRADTHSVNLQLDVLNLANRLNVINFAGLFSGTAIGTPRSAQVRLHIEF